MKTTLFRRYVETGEYTMAALARALGYSPEYLSRIRHGKAPVTDSFVGRVCRRLAVPREQLFEEGGLNAQLGR